MQKVMIVGCGAYMDASYGCPGEWRCLKAASLGEGEFDQEGQVVGFVRCECPGRATATNVALSIKGSEIRPDAIYLSTCLVKPKPACPHMTADELAAMIQAKTGIPVHQGTHAYV